MGREGTGWEGKGKGRDGMGSDCPLSEILNTPLIARYSALNAIATRLI